MRMTSLLLVVLLAVVFLVVLSRPANGARG
jgi:hypothetical protein